MKNKKRIVILLVVVLAIYLFFPYIKAEYLTFRYGNQFVNGYEQCHMIDSIEYLRVLNYNKKKSTAKVLYIAAEHSSANIFYFKKKNGLWIMDSWDTIWSKTGSADDFMWPYYP